MKTPVHSCDNGDIITAVVALYRMLPLFTWYEMSIV